MPGQQTLLIESLALARFVRTGIQPLLEGLLTSATAGGQRSGSIRQVVSRLYRTGRHTRNKMTAELSQQAQGKHVIHCYVDCQK